MMQKIRRALCATLLLLVAGCGVQPDKAAKVPVPFDPAVKGPPSHRIDPARSSARIYVYRAGMMSNLGHNHIVLARAIHGELWLQATPVDSAFHLSLPVDSLVVDPPELRAQAGAEFSTQPTAADIEGTRRNMLGEKVLNAERYPEIEIWSQEIYGSGDKLTADIIVAVGGKLSVIAMPLTLGMTGETITASGKSSLNQTDIGITPFSIMMGAIAVRDELEIEYTVTATPAD
jgi:hypothetical protein